MEALSTYEKLKAHLDMYAPLRIPSLYNMPVYEYKNTPEPSERIVRVRAHPIICCLSKWLPIKPYVEMSVKVCDQIYWFNGMLLMSPRARKAYEWGCLS